MAAESSYVKTNALGTLQIRNSAGTTTKDLSYDRGDVSITGLNARLNEHQTVSRRGRHVCGVWGARTYPQITFSAYWTNLVGSDDTPPGSMIEFLTLLGAYDGESPISGSGSSRPATVNLRLTVDSSSVGDANDETVTLTDVQCTFEVAEAADGNTITVTGTVQGSVTFANGSQSIALTQIGG